jgi:hypothetical protein
MRRSLGNSDFRGNRLDKVQGMISTVGAEALKNKTFKHGTKKPVELKVSTASVVVS